jgi:hypothetical protein
VGVAACHQRVQEDSAENSGDEDDATKGAWTGRIKRGLVSKIKTDCTLRRHIAVANGCNAELQEPPVVQIVYVHRGLLARDANHRQPPHVREQDVLKKVKNQNKKSGILV